MYIFQPINYDQAGYIVYISTFTLLALKANLKYQVTRPFTICSSGKSYDQAGLAKLLCNCWYGGATLVRTMVVHKI